MRKSSIIILALIILIIPSVVSIESYNETGSSGNRYSLGSGLFNENVNSSTVTKLISNRKFHPLVGDLDNDGVNEIVAVDENNVRIYRSTTLDIVDAYTIPIKALGVDLFSNPVLYDIDNDGFTEFIISRNAFADIIILEYNGTSFHQQASFSFNTSGNYVDGEMLIKCGEPEKCMIVANKRLIGLGGIFPEAHAAPFNSTQAGTLSLVGTGSILAASFCMPLIQSMPYEDYDNDDSKEYIFTLHEHPISGASNIRIGYIKPEANNTVTSERFLSTAIATTGTGNKCDNTNSGKWITSPLVFNADGASGNGLETVFGYMTDGDSFRMASLKGSGSTYSTALIDTYIEGDAEILSNPILMDAFPVSKTGSRKSEFCVLGYKRTTSLLDMVCASEIYSFQLRKSAHFTNVFTGFNVSSAYKAYETLAHSGSHSSLDFGGGSLNVNTDEIINPYGVYRLTEGSGIGDITDCLGLLPPFVSVCKLERIFEMPKQNAAAIAVDYEKKGFEDIILMTTSGLTYVNDGFINSAPAFTGSASFNPCITDLNTIIKQNTTVAASFRAADPNSDNIAYRLIAYKGLSNEQDTGYTSNFSSGTEVTLSFIANLTGTSFILELQALDSNSDPKQAAKQFLFNVGTTGVSFGDCISTFDFDAPVTTEEEDELLISDPARDPIRNFAQEIKNLTGLGATVLWLIIMAVVGYAIVANGSSSWSAQQLFSFLIIVEGMLLIIGAITGFIGVGIIILIAIIGIIAVSLFMRKVFFGSQT